MLKIRFDSRHLLALSLLAAASCGDGGASDPGAPQTSHPADPSDPSDPSDPAGPLKGKAESFESDLPESLGGQGGVDGGASVPVSSAPTADADSAGGKAASTAERAIVEADIIQVEGNRLYALSRVAGLTVVDLTDTTQLKILGRFRELSGTPFEMYLRNGVVLAMYSSWGQYVKTATGYSYVATSKVVALDVNNPASIANIGSFDVAGEVSDSRVVGDVMYVVGYQNGYCWSCAENKPQTSVLSLNIADVRQVRKVDELFFADTQNQYGWGRRSVTVTQQRMYVAGPEYGQTEPTGSTIQVVDITDPGGDLVEGATVAAKGQITSRWQMDEHEGVLRVISQTPTWWAQSQQAPLVQTFKINSSTSLSKLGETPLIIPPNEQLNTVRFDGVRGYAITSERKDPLFTIDLSNPAAPRQVGELVMPGWIYHLEPRGNRLIGLGYDQGNSAGAITVSVFDVTNLAAPKLLDRVNFGGDWGYLPEDQDRIHKAFRILPEQGLILVPYSGYSSWSRNGYCSTPFRSGVQLVDLAGDDLTLRGSAPARGEARRAFLQGPKLVTVSDEAVDSFDIGNRDAPLAEGKLSIARYVSHALPLSNGAVARINEDWYGQQNSTIDFVKLEEVDHPELSLGELDLSALLAGSSQCAPYTWISEAFVEGNQINVAYQRYDYDGFSSAGGKQVRGLLTLDASDPSKAVVLSQLESATTSSNYGEWYGFSNYYRYGYSAAQTNALRTHNAVVFLEQRYQANSQYATRLRVIDLTDPKAPREALLSLDAASGYSGLVRDGNNVMLSHYDVGKNGRARFYLDRVDLSQPATPKLASKVNVPGSLLHYDQANNRLLTSELQRTVVEKSTAEACTKRFAYADFRYPDNYNWTNVDTASVVGTCTGYQQKLHLVRFVDGGAVRDDTYVLPEDQILSSSSMGDGRVAAVVGHSFSYGYLVGDCFDCGYGYGYGSVARPSELLTLGGFDTGRFVTGHLSVGTNNNPWWGFWGAPPVYMHGTRALVQSQTDSLIVDLTDVAAPSLLRKQPLYGYASDLSASGNMVLLSLGQLGVQRIDL
jgi:hypothetical protein